MVEVREARYFIAVAQELSYRRAAERLHMSQPPLSQAIKALEQRLGVQLLRRSTREVALTAAGQVFLDRCRTLLATAEAADDAARAAAGGRVGRLRVAAVASAFVDPLPRALQRFARDHPLVELHMQETDTRLAVEALRRGDIDVALVRQLGAPRGLRRETLHSEPFVLAVPEVWDGAPVINRLEDASDVPWTFIPRDVAPDYADQVVACCRAAGFAPEARHTAGSISSQLAMVGCGLGVALVPQGARQQAAQDDPDRLRLIALRRPRSIELAALWRPDATAPVAALLESILSR